jgi:hypothetical protein
MTRMSALVLALLATPAVAAEPAPLTAASATRLSTGEVKLDVTYDGGACEATEEAEVTTAEGTVDAVSIPTRSTAEMCTMQIVPVSYSGTIAVEPGTTELAVTVLDPDGQPKAGGSVPITAAN